MKLLTFIAIIFLSLNIGAQDIPEPETTISGNVIETKTYIDSFTYIIEGRIFKEAEDAEDEMYQRDSREYKRLMRSKDRLEKQLQQVKVDPDSEVRIKVVGSPEEITLLLEGKSETAKVGTATIQRAIRSLGISNAKVVENKRKKSTLYTVTGSGLENLTYEIN